MKIAISESAFPECPRADAMQAAAAAGADGVELVFADARAVAELTQPDRMAEIVAVAAAVGIAIPSIALDANASTDGLLRETDATEAAMDQVRAAMAGAVELGAKTILLPFFRKAAIEQESDLGVLCDALAEFGDEADEKGLTLGVESMLSANRKIYLSDRTGGIGVRHYYDVGNVLIRRLDPATELRDLGADRICQLHFKDVLVAEGRPPEMNLRMGQGQVDFPAIVRSLRAIGYDGWICLETPGGDHPADAAAENVAFARKLLEV